MSNSKLPEIDLLRLRLQTLQRIADDTEHILEQYTQAQDELRESEERFRLLVDGVKDYAIFMLDVNGNILTWNSGAERIKGYRADEIIGKNFSTFYPAVDIENKKPEMELLVASRDGKYEEEGWRVRKDGSLFWANVLITALFDSAGVLRGYGKVTRDMTDRQRAQIERERLHQSELALEREREAHRQRDIVLHAQEQFLNAAAHELRTPVTSIIGYAELIQRRLDQGDLDGDRLRRPVRALVDQAYRLRRMTSAFLDQARLANGQLVIERRVIDLVEIVSHVVDQFQLLAEQHQWQVVLPPTSILIDGDELRIEQIIYNLLQNAVKFSSPGSTITVELQQTDGWGELAITDRGVGIESEELPRLFDRFYRAKNTSDDQPSGWGIGLYIVKEFIAAHDGIIEVESEYGEGSRFSLKFPLHDMH